jgi:hypothetical protein
MGERSLTDPKRTDPIRIVTAQPGWVALRPLIGKDDSVKELEEMPVVAWAVYVLNFRDRPGASSKDPEGYYAFKAIPVSTETLSPMWALRSPSGDLFTPHGQRFSTEQELINYFAEAYRKDVALDET